MDDVYRALLIKNYEQVHTLLANNVTQDSKLIRALCLFGGLGVKNNDLIADDLVRECVAMKRRISNATFSTVVILADQGLAAAKIVLAACYYNGICVATDPVKALGLLEEVCAQEKHPYALASLGHCYLRQNKYDEAIESFRQSNEQGCAEALFGLGMCYLKGLGTELDAGIGLDYMENAAGQGHAYALYYMSIMCAKGVKPDQDHKASVRFLEQAADKKVREAIYDLAGRYFNGLGVEKDEQTAVRLFRQAANLEYPPAMHDLATCYMRGLGTNQNPRLGFYWYHKASREGHPPSHVAVGKCYEEGVGVIKDPTEAAAYYIKGCEANDGTAFFCLVGLSDQR